MKALLCIHGILSTHKDFIYLKSFLKNKYDNIIVFDLPGHGNNNIEFTLDNTLSYCLNLYDSLLKKYDEVDIIGYSLGGVIALYIQYLRPVNNLILVSPALKYLNLKNYELKKTKSNYNIREILPNKSNKRYLFTFVNLVYYVKKMVTTVYPKTLIIWGNKDYLVKESSGYYIYRICTNKIKSYIIFNGLTHFNILNNLKVALEIEKFLSV